MPEHELCVLHQMDDRDPEQWVPEMTIDAETAANLKRLGGTLTDGEAATALWRRHLYRIAPDILEAEGEDHRQQLAKKGLWPEPEGEANT
jgi:hypothetical protein